MILNCPSISAYKEIQLRTGGGGDKGLSCIWRRKNRTRSPMWQRLPCCCLQLALKFWRDSTTLSGKTEGDDAEDKTKYKFQKEFAGMKRVVFARYQFWDYQRGEAQPFDEFLTQLKTLAQACKFLEVDNMVRDKIMFSTMGKSLKEWLLREVDSHLQRAVDLCHSAKITHKEMQSMKSSDGETSHATAIDQNIHGIQGKPPRAGQPKPKGRKCKRCGCEHPIRQCSAWGKHCMRCGGANHFSWQCFARYTSPQLHEVSAQHSEDEFFIDSLYVGNINTSEDGHDPAWFSILKVHSSHIQMKLDTGAAANILPLKTFNKLKNPPQLQ